MSEPIRAGFWLSDRFTGLSAKWAELLILSGPFKTIVHAALDTFFLSASWCLTG